VDNAHRLFLDVATCRFVKINAGQGVFNHAGTVDGSPRRLMIFVENLGIRSCTTYRLASASGGVKVNWTIILPLDSADVGLLEIDELIYQDVTCREGKR
jgi:hypothetical protein